MSVPAIRAQLARPQELPGKAWQLAREMTGLGYPRGSGRPGALTVGIDATPLVGARTGVGRYVERVSTTMAGFEDAPDQVWTLFSRRLPLSADLPAHARLAQRAVPSRFLQPLWRRFGAPKVEYLTGPIDVFHGGNFVMPPTRAAATVVTVHDLAFRFFPETVHPATMAVLQRLPSQLDSYDAILCVSHAVADEITAEFGLPPERIVVAHNGVDPAWADATPLAGPDLRRIFGEAGVPQRYFFFLGTMEPRKNLPTLLAGHAAARAADPDLPDLVIVGGSGWGEAIRTATGVHTVGFLDDADVRGLLAGAVAVCSPSLYEGFGLPVVEALAAGRPVLASDIAAHREVADDRADLIPPTDSDAWADALLRMAGRVDPPGASAERRAVAARFTWQASARTHLDTYRALAAR